MLLLQDKSRTDRHCTLSALQRKRYTITPNERENERTNEQFVSATNNTARPVPLEFDWQLKHRNDDC